MRSSVETLGIFFGKNDSNPEFDARNPWREAGC